MTSEKLREIKNFLESVIDPEELTEQHHRSMVTCGNADDVFTYGVNIGYADGRWDVAKIVLNMMKAV